MRATFKPRHHARLVGLDHMTAIVGWWELRSLIHDQLDIPDTAVELRVEVSRQRMVSDVVRLLRLLVLICVRYRVPEDAVLGKEHPDEVVPILCIILALRALRVLSVCVFWSRRNTCATVP